MLRGGRFFVDTVYMTQHTEYPGSHNCASALHQIKQYNCQKWCTHYQPHDSVLVHCMDSETIHYLHSRAAKHQTSIAAKHQTSIDFGWNTSPTWNTGITCHSLTKYATTLRHELKRQTATEWNNITEQQNWMVCRPHLQTHHWYIYPPTFQHTQTDWVKVLHPTGQKIGYFGDVLPSQFLDLLLKKLNLTQH